MINIALVGDYNSSSIAHQAIPQAIGLAAKALGVTAQASWRDTSSLELSPQLSNYDAIWCVPGSPYKSMQGALQAIAIARKEHIPFLGTCGGFQHVLIEYARNVLGLAESDHTESNPGATLALITPLTCSLVGTKGTIILQSGSRIEKIYNAHEITEPFNCNFGLNQTYQPLIEAEALLRITGTDLSSNARVVELDDHPFFIATLYQPERSALTGIAHPLIKAFIQAAALKRCPTA